MALNFRRGSEAIAESKKKAESGGKNFKPFAPRIAWTDGDKKYVIFLTPIEEMPTVEMHEYVPIGEWQSKDKKKKGKRYGFYISQTDPAIGGDHDIISDEFGKKPTERTLAVAVELEPVMETVKGRKKPVGFEVKTETFTRKGEDDQDVEVTTPVIGVVAQASSNFFGYLANFDEEEGPVAETAFSVKREGDGTDTEYHFSHYMDQPVDLAGVVENVFGILYLDEELDDVVAAVEDLNDEEAAAYIANAILDARLDELSDLERYQEETKSIKVIENRWGEDYVRNTEVEDNEEVEEEPEEKPAPRRRRAAKQTEEKPKPRRSRKPKEEPEEEPETEEEPAEDEAENNAAKRTRFAEMRRKAEKTK